MLAKKRKAEEMDDSSREPGEAAVREHFPVLRLLVGNEVDPGAEQHEDIPTLADIAILDRVDAYIENKVIPPLIFQGRDDCGRRVNYDPNEQLGMNTEFVAAFTSLPETNRLHRLEATIKRFVCWNRTLFPELTDSKTKRKKYPWGDPGEYQSVLEILEVAEGCKLAPPSNPRTWNGYVSYLYGIVETRVLEKVSLISTLQLLLMLTDSHSTRDPPCSSLRSNGLAMVMTASSASCATATSGLSGRLIQLMTRTTTTT